MHLSIYLFLADVARLLLSLRGDSRHDRGV